RIELDVVSLGIDNDSDFKGSEVKQEGVNGSSFLLATKRGQIEARVPLAGRHNIYNALAAATVADLFEAPLEEIAGALSETPAPKMRGEVLRFRGGFSVIDDSYNSNPRALFEMVSTVGAHQEMSRAAVVCEERVVVGAPI